MDDARRQTIGGSGRLLRPKRCPVCGSTRVSLDGAGTFSCARCGYRNARISS